MNLKRALWVSIVTYFTSFVLGLVLMFVAGVDASRAYEAPNTLLYVNLVITILLSAFFTLLYFNGNGIKPSAKQGFLFGLVLIIVGFVLDVLLFSLSALFTSVDQSILEYYSNPIFWITLVLFVLSTTAVGVIKEKSKS